MDQKDGSSAVDLEPPPITDAGSSPPLGSPDDTVHDDLLPPCIDDDASQDHGDDIGDLNHGDRNSETGVLTDDLKLKIVKQVEYYFSDENLPTDKYLLTYVKKNKEGFVPISLVASFRKMKKLTRDLASIVTALKESSLLVLSSDGKRVKRLNPLAGARDPKSSTVVVENLPDHSVENLRKMFGEAGKIKNISIHDPHSSEDGRKKEKLVSTKLHAIVEYETVEAAEKAAATLNDEQDWRNGLRVKLLSQVGKYGQKRPTWREPDSEKNNGGRLHEQAAGEGHGHEIPDEEDKGIITRIKPGTKAKTADGQGVKTIILVTTALVMEPHHHRRHHHLPIILGRSQDRLLVRGCRTVLKGLRWAVAVFLLLQSPAKFWIFHNRIRLCIPCFYFIYQHG